MTRPEPENTVVVIPARMASVRLPGKPLAGICGEPMIVHVWRRAIEARVGQVLVAVAEREIADAIEAAGGTAVLTDPDLPSGSDRVAQALERTSLENPPQYVVNLQGDLPTIDPAAISACVALFSDKDVDITTLVALITSDEERTSPSVVKALIKGNRAVDFVRRLPDDARPPFWHHIGIYGYRYRALMDFVALEPGPRECARRLEQMRALDNNMTIGVAKVASVPFGVDTPEDLQRARAVLAGSNT